MANPTADGLTWEDVDGLTWPEVDGLRWTSDAHRQSRLVTEAASIGSLDVAAGQIGGLTTQVASMSALSVEAGSME